MTHVLGDDFLEHYGRKGMKWGEHIFGKDDPKLKYYGETDFISTHDYPEDYRNDFGIKKGTKYQRVTHSKKEKKVQSTYVSRNALDYSDWDAFDDSKTYVSNYKTTKDFIVAGQRSINRILREIGDTPIRKVSVNSKDYSKANKHRDFMSNNPDLRSRFINQAKKEGYSAMLDPVDSKMGVGYSPTATIVFDDVLEKLSTVPIEELYK